MPISWNLSVRLLAILTAAFVVIQALIWTFMTLPGGGDGERPYNLPTPAQARVIVDVIEATPPARRAALLDALDASTYSIRILDHAPRVPERDGEGLEPLRRGYEAALGGRSISVLTRRPLLGRLAGDQPWPIRFFAPIRLTLPLADGTLLAFESRPSPVVRSYLRQRAKWALLIGLLTLAALAVAVRQTTRPLVRLADNVDAFASDLAAPDLPERGSRELRDLARTFNAMKRRIRSLVDERTRILAAVAHDMRTYLTRLRLRAEFLEGEQRERAIADLEEMAALLDDTLLFARPDAARGAERFDLAAELAAVAGLRTEMGDAVTLAPPPGPLPVAGSLLGLRRILANLIDNGLRHGSRVAISAMRVDDAAEIRVTDDGPGVPDAALARLGEPFGRLDPSRDRSTGGAGLGLAIVRALVARDGGSVAFANRPEGGFEVCVRLPLAEDAALP